MPNYEGQQRRSAAHTPPPDYEEEHAPAHDKTKKVEKQGYMLLLETDDVSAPVGEAARRLAKGKQPYPVLVPSDWHLALFKSKFAEIRQLWSGVVERGETGWWPPEYAAQVAKMDDDTIPVIVYSGTGFLGTLPSQSSKLYVHGHGFGGEDSLTYYTGKEGNNAVWVPLKDIAEGLRKHGLPVDYHDVRLFACYGANDDYGEPMGQQLDQAMRDAGFANIQVSAYAASVLGYPGTDAESRLHSVARDADGQVHRRSAFRVRFVALPDVDYPDDALPEPDYE